MGFLDWLKGLFGFARPMEQSYLVTTFKDHDYLMQQKDGVWYIIVKGREYIVVQIGGRTPQQVTELSTEKNAGNVVFFVNPDGKKGNISRIQTVKKIEEK